MSAWIGERFDPLEKMESCGEVVEWRKKGMELGVLPVGDVGSEKDCDDWAASDFKRLGIVTESLWGDLDDEAARGRSVCVAGASGEESCE
jgi:hypothetical protein